MKNIQRVYTAHTINSIALSLVSIYVPAYLLSLGFSLPRVILFFIITHGVGLVFGIFAFTWLVKKWGILKTFVLYYPLQIIYLLLLSLIKVEHLLPEIIAIVGGLASFAYWIPMNMFLIKHSEQEEMGSSLSKFFAFPQIAGIVGPFLSAILIPFFGFWPVFVLSIFGLFLSFLPLLGLKDTERKVEISLPHALHRLVTNKTLFLFEFLDNIIEESDWFWSIYVFLIIGSLSAPGIVGGLQSLGGAVFTLFIGKFTNAHWKKLIPLAAILLMGVTIARILIIQPLSAYILTVIASIILTLFLVVYFSGVYKKVKNDNEEEFMVLREIPTVAGRMVVFGFIYLTLHFLRFFFLLPLCTVILLLVLYFIKGRTALTKALESGISAK